MKLLIQEGFVEGNPEAVARFLRNTEGLDKTKIGEYLGEIKIDFNLKVMHAFIDSFSFKDLFLDLAIRRLLATFRLPGEAQKIDKIMEKFAERFYSQNPNTFVNAGK
jgi:brefeldin A-inhibited guanine nucleotide-exchange protein